ncbi:MAG: polyprenyl diphosphate synthase [Candidatus Krumholzibacteriia bacterium]
MGAEDLKRLAELDTDALFAAVAARGNLPRHVAVIMDGNGRWAQKRFLPRVAGHRAGRHAVRRCVTAAGRLGVGVLTLYTFSQENFGRPETEVKALWRFLEESLLAEREDLHRRNVRLVATGDLAKLPDVARRGLEDAVAALSGNSGLVLNLALAYGGRQEIVAAARRLAAEAAAGRLDPAEIDEETFASRLYSPGLPDPDLVIRTSGEARLSNFLIWQAAYSELLITPVLWPDFSERDFLLAVADYQGRERRFGGLPAAEGARSPGDGDSVWEAARWQRLLKVKP